MAHRRACARDERLGRILGICVVVLATVVGTSVFATIESTPSTAAQVLTGLLSLGAGVLAALQTFLGLDSRASRHRDASVQYGAIRRELEQLRAAGMPADAAIADLRRRWDEIDAAAPGVPARIHQAAREDVVARGEAAAS